MGAEMPDRVAGGTVIGVLHFSRRMTPLLLLAALPAYAVAGGATASAAPGVRPVPVPKAAQAANTSRPDHVIGNGTPRSCTSRKVVRAVAKGGNTNLVDVIHYAEPVESRGLIFMDSPGYDPISVTGQPRAATWSRYSTLSRSRSARRSSSSS